MTLEDAIQKACDLVGIKPPRARAYGRWLHADTLSGRNGKGDGRLIINDTHVTAWNWQTGETETVSLLSDAPPAERRRIARQVKEAREERRREAECAAGVARALLSAARPGPHPYLAGKGFPDEQVLVASADVARRVAGNYLVPDGALKALVIPVRDARRNVTSAQLIWEDGTKKFLAGGALSGASHRISTGHVWWICEGFATGLSLRAALKGFGVSASVVVAFSASNVAAVARSLSGRRYIAADNDKPLEQFGWRGTGEHYASATGLPWTMPPDVGTDFNDMHASDGIFAVQAFLARFMREVAMPP